MKVQRTVWITVYLKHTSGVNLFCVLQEIKKSNARSLESHFLRGEQRTPLHQRDNLLLFHCDGRDFNSGIVDQGRSLNGCASRLWVRHDALIDLVHVREFVNVGEVDRHADHVFQFEASGFQDLLNIVEGRGGLGTDASRDQLVGIVGTLLACDVQSIAGYDAVAERKSSVG